MTPETLSSYERYRQRYLDGRLPWDDPLPPPEVIELVDALPPGRALDLGCGYGRSSIYLALNGWSADGIDYVPEAIEEAQRRAAIANVAARTSFHVASATAMPFLASSYDLAIDIGCLHSFDELDRRAYLAELTRLLPTGGWYLLFAHLTDDSEPVADGPSGIAEETILDLFANEFELRRFEKGVTQMEDKPPWLSGWYWYERR